MTFLIVFNSITIMVIAILLVTHLLTHLRKLENHTQSDKCSCGHAWSFHNKDNKCLAYKSMEGMTCRCVNFDGTIPAHIEYKDML